MNYTISNSKLQVSILSKGVEISSIKSVKTGKEFMWDANSDIWGSHAPVLFPIIGALKDDKCFFDGIEYKIPKHGFVRHNESIKMINKTQNSVDFQLQYSDDTLKMYPFKFIFNISFKLEGAKLIVSHKVENVDDKDILFSLGAHPAFNCPLNSNEQYEDYYLEFETEETAETSLLGVTGLISDKTSLVMDKTTKLPLTKNLFDNDALIFKNLKSRKVSLKSNKLNQVLTMRFDDFNYLGIWAKPGAPFVCIEPWLGIADNENTDGEFENKDGIIRLPIGESYNAQFSIEIEE